MPEYCRQERPVLDPEAAASFYGLVRDLHAEGITILMITHDVGPALASATRILQIGGAVFFGSRQDFLQTGAGRRFARREGGTA